jgi:hypothetical protein
MTASWINSLVDSGVKSDMLNFAADGVSLTPKPMTCWPTSLIAAA